MDISEKKKIKATHTAIFNRNKRTIHARDPIKSAVYTRVWVMIHKRN